ncbi:TetR/AcrR family transcriptional regulator [Nocardioides sp. zg-1228]|uniref:TetR/AcrR family transcriptional regulator n=1 Tax=Nocardioides sp. zg-1228 TaxID=2763008 RepID=UPI0016433669|nr:TetR/AcrR family transcriptional regulator [Nocardioides sp. zg-1228]MBC2934004.1 TetR/AcrR family transcriptional regulator [Nocardioides sp. zg-1228]QSF58760.1 TetR family transcriptional regulator [Nocardioides sp. zg-1228]
MTEGATRRGRPGHDQHSVVRVAVELFNRQGYDATSVGDVARELGLTKSAIYHHVPSKEHLLQSAVDEALDALTAALDEVADTEGLDAGQRLRVAVRASVTVLVHHLPAVTLLLRVHGNTPVEKAALARRRAIDERLADMVRDAVDEGVLRDDLDPLVISRLLFGMVNSLVEWVRPGIDADALGDALVALAFDGLTHGTAPGSGRGTAR